MEQMVEDKIRLHKLYDHYNLLLTEKQRMYFEYYYLDDYSLSEIATLLDVSRNAVHEQLKIVINHLEHYEEVLHNFEKGQIRKELYTKFYDLTKEETVLALVKELEKVE